MAVLYKTVQSILANKAGVKVYYPRVVLKGHVSTDQIAREIAEYSSLSKGDTKNVIDNLVRVLTTHLQSSERVSVPDCRKGLPTFPRRRQEVCAGADRPAEHVFFSTGRGAFSF